MTISLYRGQIIEPKIDIRGVLDQENVDICYHGDVNSFTTCVVMTIILSYGQIIEPKIYTSGPELRSIKLNNDNHKKKEDHRGLKMNHNFIS